MPANHFSLSLSLFLQKILGVVLMDFLDYSLSDAGMQWWKFDELELQV
jgi:hypothetical protein